MNFDIVKKSMQFVKSTLAAENRADTSIKQPTKPNRTPRFSLKHLNPMEYEVVKKFLRRFQMTGKPVDIQREQQKPDAPPTYVLKNLSETQYNTLIGVLHSFQPVPAITETNLLPSQQKHITNTEHQFPAQFNTKQATFGDSNIMPKNMEHFASGNNEHGLNRPIQTRLDETLQSNGIANNGFSSQSQQFVYIDRRMLSQKDLIKLMQHGHLEYPNGFAPNLNQNDQPFLHPGMTNQQFTTQNRVRR